MTALAYSSDFASQLLKFWKCFEWADWFT